jgi:diadenylate cyclase
MTDILPFWKPAIEILILWMVIYHILLFFEGSRAVQVLRGIIILLLAFFLFQKFDFAILDWLFTKFFAVSVLAFLIIFQDEIRQGLARLGRRHLFDMAIKEEQLDVVLKEVINAAEHLCRNKIGALIVLAKDDPLTEYIETGVTIDSRVSSEMIETVFTPNSLLHDGGLVIQRGRIMASGCLFPLSQKHDLSRIFGTRHRAALGLSEQTDAVIIIVSEERQDMSLVYRGNLNKDLGREDIFSKIKEIMETKKSDV